MPDSDDLIDEVRFRSDIPSPRIPFFLKGSGSVGWGMQNRLARIFRPSSGRTAMLAIDHGYIQGPTTGLERVDLTIPELLPETDALMVTRGIVRAAIPADTRTPLVLRASGGPSVLTELSDEYVAMSMEDACRINAAAVAVQVFIGGPHEARTVHNLTKLVDSGLRHGIPVLAVTAVGKELTRDSRYLRLAARICAELGANFVKTYHCADDFDTVVAACPVPVIVAGGKKLPELEALRMTRAAIDAGASGVDMGRNIFQSGSPRQMLRAVNAVVHEDMPAEAAAETHLRPLQRSAP